MNTLYLINPLGSVVEIEGMEEYERLLKKGFSIPTPTQVADFMVQREMQWKKSNPNPKAPIDLYYCSVPLQKDGYGVASEELQKAFDQIGVSYSQAQSQQKIGFLFHSPYSVTRLDNPIKIIYTMFESDKLPTDWKEYLEVCDEIIVPSRWCMEIFAKSGYNTKVVPLGFNQEAYTYKDREIKTGTDKPFTFLHYDAYNMRKGFREVLKAFLKAFDKTEPVRMLFKTTRETVPFTFPPAEYPNIKVITGVVPDEEMADICQQSDCFVYPSQGEGFGMTPLEAMGTGLPCILPNAHGLSEYFNKECMYEVKVQGRCPAVYTRYQGQDVGSMLLTDTDDLAAQMRYVYEHEKEAKLKGKLASEYVKQYSFKNTATKLKAIFESYKEAPTVERPLANVLPLEEV